MDRMRILLAGHDGVFLELVKTFLRNTGIELVWCREPDETLEIMHRMQPDIVYLSAKIAGGGLDCLKTIMKDDDLRKTPVIMVCSNESAEYKELCRDAGCAYVIRKPIGRQAFLSSVMSFIDVRKRTNARFDAQLEVEYEVLSQKPCSSRTVNIGIGGTFIEADNALPPGTLLSLKIHLPPDDRVLKCSAHVAWVNHRDAPTKTSLPPGMGVEFFGLSEENRALLSRYLHEEHITKLLDKPPARAQKTK